MSIHEKMRDVYVELKRQEATDEMGDHSADEYIEMVKLAHKLLNTAACGPDVAEYFTEEKLSAIALGQVLMEHVSPNDRVENKGKWCEVADWMGPDYAQGLYHASVFLTRVV